MGLPSMYRLGRQMRCSAESASQATRQVAAQGVQSVWYWLWLVVDELDVSEIRTVDPWYILFFSIYTHTHTEYIYIYHTYST